LPPLLGGAVDADALGRLDGALLAVLHRAQLVPSDVLAAIEVKR
jgi:hypothetical protein